MSATSLRVRWVTPQLCHLVPLALRAISQCLPIKSSKSSKSSLYWNSVLTPGSSLKLSFRFRFFWNANWASEWVLNSVFAVLLIWDLRAVTLHEYLQEPMELTCSHIVWFWFWRLASRLHTLAKHPRVTLHLRLYAQRSARYAKPMQKASFWLCEHIAVPCLGNASEMPTKRSVIHSGRLWLTQVKVVKVLSASHIKLRGWRARLLRLPESLPLSSHPAQGQNRKKRNYNLKTARNSYFCCKMLNS